MPKRWADQHKMEEKVNIESIKAAASSVIRLLDDYRAGEKNERTLDPVLYGYLEAKFGKMDRQHWIQMVGWPRPRRIDFRKRGLNPVVIEFAVRPPTGRSQLYGSQNYSELAKLTRVPVAALRALLLMDLAPEPIPKENLQKSYRKWNAGPGRFLRKAVRVIYTHKDLQYHFVWRPHKQYR